MKRSRSNTTAAAAPSSSKNGERRITFLRGENKITYTKPPPKSDNPKHWFKEGEAITTKPLNFIIPAESAVNMDISTNVTLKRMSIVSSSDEDEKKNSKVTLGNKKSNNNSSSNSNVRCTLEVAVRDLEAELKLAKAAPKTTDRKAAEIEEERIVSANKFYAVGTCALGGDGSFSPASHCTLKAALINGIYVLRNTGTKPLAVMAMAVDIETRLQ